MASQFARDLAKDLAAAVQGLSVKSAATDIDAELQEVREVLDGLRMGEGKNVGCWCIENPLRTREPDYKHGKRCQCARALMERLRVPEVRP